MTRDKNTDRFHLAAYLAQNGATPGKVIRETFGWSNERFWNATYGPAASEWVVLGSKGWAARERIRTA